MRAAGACPAGAAAPWGGCEGAGGIASGEEAVEERAAAGGVWLEQQHQQWQRQQIEGARHT
jgi:hypothetical protein